MIRRIEADRVNICGFNASKGQPLGIIYSFGDEPPTELITEFVVDKIEGAGVLAYGGRPIVFTRSDQRERHLKEARRDFGKAARTMKEVLLMSLIKAQRSSRHGR